MFINDLRQERTLLQLTQEHQQDHGIGIENIDAIKIGGEYILDDGRIVADMRTCLWYFPSNNVVVIKAFHPSVAANWKVLEKVLSPFRSFIRDINPSF